jgi:hypothetical protein
MQLAAIATKERERGRSWCRTCTATAMSDADSCFFFAYDWLMSRDALASVIGRMPDFAQHAIAPKAWLAWDAVGVPYVEPCKCSLIVRDLNDTDFAGESEEDYARYLSSKCAPGVPFDGDSPPNVEVQPFTSPLTGRDATAGRSLQACEDRIIGGGPPRRVLGLGLVLRLPHRQARLSAARTLFVLQRYPSVCLYPDRPRQPPVPPREQAQRLSVPKELPAGHHVPVIQAVSRISDPRPTSGASNWTGSDNATPAASGKLLTIAYLAHTSDSPSCYSTCPCLSFPRCRPSLSFGIGARSV